eukprot:10074815-Karenia_brevis.AAC.1
MNLKYQIECLEAMLARSDGKDKAKGKGKGKKGAKKGKSGRPAKTEDTGAWESMLKKKYHYQCSIKAL